MSGISFNDRQIATFTISGINLRQLDHDYQQGRALVDPVILQKSLNYLRDILFEMKNFERRKRKDATPGRNRQHQTLR